MPNKAKQKDQSAPEWVEQEPKKKGPKGLSLTDGQGNQDWGHTKRPRTGLPDMPGGKGRGRGRGKGKKCAAVDKSIAVLALDSFNKMFQQ